MNAYTTTLSGFNYCPIVEMLSSAKSPNKNWKHLTLALIFILNDYGNYEKLNYLTLMLIEWTLLNEFKIPIKKGEFKCKTTHKLRQKQFNILNDEYWKLLIYNNPSFATTNFAEVCLDIVFAKINSVTFLF